jgi:hypothetical protein
MTIEFRKVLLQFNEYGDGPRHEVGEIARLDTDKVLDLADLDRDGTTEKLPKDIEDALKAAEENAPSSVSAAELHDRLQAVVEQAAANVASRIDEMLAPVDGAPEGGQ